jgi:cell fate (sporulation/competence/biofilm development) regulator YlbF (YheA/YmcA/DUF963 family)
MTLPKLETASPTQVRQTAVDFASALMQEPAYLEFEEASQRLSADPVAQSAIQAYQSKQRELQMIAQSGSVSAEDQAELEQLHQTMLAQPAVGEYFQALDDFTRVCQAAADILYDYTKLNIASACGGGCCG